MCVWGGGGGGGGGEERATKYAALQYNRPPPIALFLYPPLLRLSSKRFPQVPRPDLQHPLVQQVLLCRAPLRVPEGTSPLSPLCPGMALPDVAGHTEHGGPMASLRPNLESGAAGSTVSGFLEVREWFVCENVCVCVDVCAYVTTCVYCVPRLSALIERVERKPHAPKY